MAALVQRLLCIHYVVRWCAKVGRAWLCAATSRSTAAWFSLLHLHRGVWRAGHFESFMPGP